MTRLALGLVLGVAALAFSTASGSAGAPCSGATPAKWRPWSNVLHGDATGDGRPDAVFVGQRYPERPLCRRLLFVRTGGRTLMRPLVQMGIDWVYEPAGPAPSALVRIVRSRGAQVLVRQHLSGDGHVSYGLYAVRHGRIVRYRVPSNDDGFTAGGSAGTFSGFACVRPEAGLVIQSWAGPAGRKFVLDRNFLRAEGLRFVVLRKERVRVSDPSVFPEFGHGDRCDVVSGRPELPRNPGEPLGG